MPGKLRHRAGMHDRTNSCTSNVDPNSIGDILRNQTSNIKHQTSPHPLEHRLIYKNIGRTDWTTDIDCYLRDGGYEQLKQGGDDVAQ